MAQLFTNNALATLNGAITNVATSITLATGKGALFPNPSAPDYFVLTLTQAVSETSWERVQVTARAGDVLTVVRGFDGTTAAAWANADKAELRVGAEEMNRFAGSQEFENGILLTALDAAAPTGLNMLRAYTKRFGGSAADPGEIIPHVRGSGELGWPLMPGMLGPANWRLWRASGGSDTPTMIGGFYDAVGTVNAPGWAATSLLTRQHHTQYVSAASVNASCGPKGYACWVARSTTAGRGGFFFHARVLLLTGMGLTTSRLFVGLSDSNNDPCIAEPSAYLGNWIGFTADSADTNLKLSTRDNTTTTITDLGASVPKSLNTMYDLHFYCPPGGAKIYYGVDKSSGNTLTERVAEGSITANLPSSDVQLAKMWKRGGTSAASAVTIGVAESFLGWQTN